MSGLPYRAGVGAVLFNAAGLVFIGRRTGLPDDAPAWQMPQGGIDEGEDPRRTVLRELREEIGTDHAEILAEHPDWLTYDLPPHLVGQTFGGRYRGQRQLWFALRFLGEDSDIRLDADPHPEFSDWRWEKLAALPDLAIGFRRPAYDVLVRSFSKWAAP